MVGKRAIIEIRLVDEAEEKPSRDIEEEIWLELSKGEPRIPWFGSVEKVTVMEAA